MTMRLSGGLAVAGGLACTLWNGEVAEVCGVMDGLDWRIVSGEGRTIWIVRWSLCDWIDLRYGRMRVKAVVFKDLRVYLQAECSQRHIIVVRCL